MKKIVPLLGFALLISSVVLNIYFFISQNKIQWELVTRVIDGDTFEVKMNNKMETVRLLGADAPETVDPKVGIQCFGPQASQKTKELLENKNVVLVADDSQGNRDIYGRLLRHVYLENGTDISRFLISNGFAKEETVFDPYRKQTEYKRLQEVARNSKIGLWGACPAEP